MRFCIGDPDVLPGGSLDGLICALPAGCAGLGGVGAWCQVVLQESPADSCGLIWFNVVETSSDIL